MIRKIVFNDPSLNIFAVVDAAASSSAGELISRIDGDIYSLVGRKSDRAGLGRLPALVQLKKYDSSCKEVIDLLKQSSVGYLVATSLGLTLVYTRFRSLTRAFLPNGEEVFFRIYDPEVFRVFIKSCKQDEIERYFPNIDGFTIFHPGSHTLEQINIVQRKSYSEILYIGSDESSR